MDLGGSSRMKRSAIERKLGKVERALDNLQDVPVDIRPVYTGAGETLR